MTYNTEPFKYRRERGVTYYELSNHLGNVFVTVTDLKIGISTDGDDFAEYYEATVVSAVDYYPFACPETSVGSAMAGRKYNQGTYRYGFNGMEKDDEVKGNGNSYDFGARIFDSRIGRWLSVDPWESKYPSQSPYIGNDDNPILIIDPTGKGGIVYYRAKRKDNGDVIKRNGKPVYEVVVYAEIYVYTNDANILANLDGHVQNIQNEINNDWNSVLAPDGSIGNGKAPRRGLDYDPDVVFEVNVINAGNSEQALQTFQQNEEEAKNAIAAGFPNHYQNYICLDDLGGPNSNFQGLTDGNMGIWNVNPQRRNGHYSHEFGHLLYTLFGEGFGLDTHPPSGTTNIMSWSPNRRVEKQDIDAINYGLSPVGSDAQDVYNDFLGFLFLPPVRNENDEQGFRFYNTTFRGEKNVNAQFIGSQSSSGTTIIPAINIDTNSQIKLGKR